MGDEESERSTMKDEEEGEEDREVKQERRGGEKEKEMNGRW